MSDTYEDFVKKYEDCFVILDNKYLVKFKPGSDKNLIFISKEVGELIFRGTQTNFKRISYTFPERGLYNINDRAYLFTRVAAKQWKRAPCSKNVKLSPLISDLESSPNLSIEVIEQIINPHYPETIEEAFKIPRFFSQALSKVFAITLSDTKEHDALLWFMSKAIGRLKLEKKEITLYDPIFKQDILNFLHEKGKQQWNLIS